MFIICLYVHGIQVGVLLAYGGGLEMACGRLRPAMA